MNLRKPMASFFAAAMLLAGCSLDLGASNRNGPTDGASPSGNQSPNATALNKLEDFYKQKVAWSKCKKHPANECANVKVPLDYKKPGGKTVTIAMMKVPAANGKPIGTLFVNPGGPGGSGIDLAANASEAFSAAVRNKYDIVGFDPRGVGSSTAVDCVSDAELAKIMDTDVDLSTPEGQQTDKAITEQEAKGCQEKSGELLAHVGTESAARDLDILRGLVGDKKLNYLGFSYGTSLGGMYANLFPKKAGRLVLDGAVDPQLGGARMGYEQIVGFETAFQHYAQHCVDTGRCPLGGSVDEARAKMKALFDQALKSPFPTADPKRPLNRAALYSTVISMMYRETFWTYLDQGLSQLVEQNDGSVILRFYDLFEERQGNKFKNNGKEAFWAINCADYVPSPRAEYQQYADKLRTEAPVFGSSMMEGTDICSLWPYHPKANPGPYEAKGSAPIVVIGTKYDPATPYHWAQNLHKTLSNSVLLTWEGDGHTAYGKAGSCLNDPVDQYLLTGKVPQDGLVCPASSKSGS